ncbi:MAG: MgtC/SapB family protein [Limisphaerales bacterium]
MDFAATFQNLALALGLGLLVGLQRERAGTPLAGIRTFPLVTLFGALCALLADRLGAWLPAAGLFSLAVVIFAASLINARLKPDDAGMTTDAALLLMSLVGACVMLELRAVAVVVGGAAAVLLHLKPQLHTFATRIGEDDFRAMMQFALITLVILPVLPNRTFGPFLVLNPHKIWLLVVLIVGLSLAGYLAHRFLGPRAGTALAGLLGGLISSTATTVSQARQARAIPEASNLATAVIMLASAVVFGRVIAVYATVASGSVSAVAPPLTLLMLVTGALALAAWSQTRGSDAVAAQHTNPSELKSALVFAALFAGVLLATAAGKEYFGERGLYVVAALSGLTDMDAITLSVGQMTTRGTASPAIAWRLIVVAALANVVFKGAVAATLGGRPLFRRLLPYFGATFAAGVLILAFWPG